MTVPAWPEELPCFLLDGHGVSFPDGRLASTSDRGPGKVRRRSSASVKPFTVQLAVDSHKFARLMRFWREELSEGSLPFTMKDPLLHNTKLLDDDGEPFLDDDGEFFRLEAWMLVRFGATPPQFERTQPRAGVISLELEELP